MVYLTPYQEIYRLLTEFKEKIEANYPNHVLDVNEPVIETPIGIGRIQRLNDQIIAREKGFLGIFKSKLILLETDFEVEDRMITLIKIWVFDEKIHKPLATFLNKYKKKYKFKIIAKY